MFFTTALEAFNQLPEATRKREQFAAVGGLMILFVGLVVYTALFDAPELVQRSATYLPTVGILLVVFSLAAVVLAAKFVRSSFGRLLLVILVVFDAFFFGRSLNPSLLSHVNGSSSSVPLQTFSAKLVENKESRGRTSWRTMRMNVDNPQGVLPAELTVRSDSVDFTLNYSNLKAPEAVHITIGVGRLGLPFIADIKAQR